MKTNKSKDKEPQWIKDAARTMLQGTKESYGDEDQNDVMQIIEDNEEDQL